GQLGEEQWLDFAQTGCADEEAIAVSPDGRYAYLAIGGRHTAARITLRDRQRATAWPFSFQEAPVGANPRALAVSSDGRRLWVCNYLGNSLSVVDAHSMTVVGTVELGPAP